MPEMPKVEILARRTFLVSDHGESFYKNRLQVHDRGGEACLRCGTRIKCMKQAGRGAGFCPRCENVAK
ncbi:MAG: hypothetical protein KGR98_02655 [Verrucomicrobia bacterium]|nr:hypothetical protein [Verrucomicrobiota bacterium]MDE3099859.1 hypothetical protein [Verrucomicrobiota bacterium]